MKTLSECESALLLDGRPAQAQHLPLPPPKHDTHHSPRVVRTADTRISSQERRLDSRPAPSSCRKRRRFGRLWRWLRCSSGRAPGQLRPPTQRASGLPKRRRMTRWAGDCQLPSRDVFWGVLRWMRMSERARGRRVPFRFVAHLCSAWIRARAWARLALRTRTDQVTHSRTGCGPDSAPSSCHLLVCSPPCSLMLTAPELVQTN